MLNKNGANDDINNISRIILLMYTLFMLYKYKPIEKKIGIKIVGNTSSLMHILKILYSTISPPCSQTSTIGIKILIISTNVKIDIHIFLLLCKYIPPLQTLLTIYYNKQVFINQQNKVWRLVSICKIEDSLIKRVRIIQK